MKSVAQEMTGRTCLSCGTERWVPISIERGFDECANCGYVGWAPTGDDTTRASTEREGQPRWAGLHRMEKEEGPVSQCAPLEWTRRENTGP